MRASDYLLQLDRHTVCFHGELRLVGHDILVEVVLQQAVIQAPQPRHLRATWQIKGERTPQVGMSSCKTWYENEFQVSYETWPQTHSFSYQVLRSSFLKLGNPSG